VNRWRVITATCIATTLSAALLTVAEPAAALPGLQRVVVNTATDSTNTKRAVARCPIGTQVVGGGASIVNGVGQVLLTGYRMVDSVPDYVLVSATEDQDLYSGSWALYAYAICAAPVAGVQIVSNSSAGGSPSNQTVIVSCPAGTQVFGMGGWIDGGNGQVILDAVYVLAGLTGVGAIGVEDEDGYAANWVVTAFAVCAPPVSGQQSVSAQQPPSGFDSTSPKTVTLSCPAGTAVHGIGGRLQGALQDNTLDDLVPSAALDSVIVKAYEDQDGEPDGWFLTAIAICAP